MSSIPTERTDYMAVAAGAAAAIVATVLYAFVFNEGMAAGLRFGAGVLAGAGIGVLNFSILRVLVGGILTSQSRRGKLLLFLGMKILGLIGAVYLLLVVAGLPLLAFGVGFVSTPLAIVIDALVWRNASKDAPGVEPERELS